MKSPFPGMDPFIEGSGLWEDFHYHLVDRIGERLAAAVSERYLVRTGERSYVVLVESEGRQHYPFLPDVSISRSRRRKPGAEAGVAMAEPVSNNGPILMRAFVEEEHREAFVEIYRAGPKQRLVTTIDVPSPSNKRPGTPGWDLYQRTRQSVLLADVNLVEIDLLRGGRRMPMLAPWPNSPYALLVARAKKSHLCRVWPAHFQEPLPSIPIPLAPPDQDITLELQPMVDGIYERFRYDRSIDYRKGLLPPLDARTSAWLKRQRMRR